jgi:hexosaminidase
VVPGLDEQDILGVEAALWTETIRTRADIERMAFPRVAAAAELAWSPAADEAGQRGWPAFRRRLAALGTHWSDAGIGFERADGVDWADRSSPA